MTSGDLTGSEAASIIAERGTEGWTVAEVEALLARLRPRDRRAFERFVALALDAVPLVQDSGLSAEQALRVVAERGGR